MLFRRLIMVGDREQEFGFLYAFAKTRLSELSRGTRSGGLAESVGAIKISSPVRGEQRPGTGPERPVRRPVSTIKPKTRPSGRGRAVLVCRHVPVALTSRAKRQEP